jgi:hypothetical protein
VRPKNSDNGNEELVEAVCSYWAVGVPVEGGVVDVFVREGERMLADAPERRDPFVLPANFTRKEAHMHRAKHGLVR